jgi:hypothetical protein
MIRAIVSPAIFVACLMPAACNPDLGAGRPAPAIAPCEGTNVVIHGFDATTGCDLTPPQTLDVVVEHVAPWTPVQTDTFYRDCDLHGGTVTDTTGDAWVCTAIDY